VDVYNEGSYASPLVVAIGKGGYTNKIRLLLKAGADPNIPDDVCFLHDLDVLLILLFSIRCFS
jgi:hypothetical protein